MSIKKAVISSVSITLAILISLYVLKQIDKESLLQQLAYMNILYLAPAFLIYCAGIFLRAARWRLFYPSDSQASMLASYSALVLGNASNLIIPARGGDIVRIIVLGQLSGLSNSKSLATVLTERIFDLLMLCALIGCVALMLPLPDSIATGAEIIAGISFIGIAGALVTIGLYDRHSDWIDQKLIKRFPSFLHHRLHELMQGLGQGMKLMKGPCGVLFVGYTLAIWAMEIGLLYLLAKSLSFSVSSLHAVTTFLCTAVGTLIPLSTAQIGVFEFIVVSTLESFGYDPAKALALGIVWHAVILFYPVILGLVTWLIVRPALKAAEKKQATIEETAGQH